MGSWSSSPFGSDSALDALGDLATATAELDEDGHVVAGTVDRTELEDRMHALLRGAAVAPGADTDPYDRHHSSTAAFAVAGLVLARLSGIDARSEGTTLFGEHRPIDVSGLPTLAEAMKAHDERPVSASPTTTVTWARRGRRRTQGVVDVSRRVRLLEALELGSHCGFLNLVDVATALALRDDALTALRTLSEPGAWPGSRARMLDAVTATGLLLLDSAS